MMPEFLPLQRTTTSELMKNLMETPEDFFKHVKFASDSAILQISYGYTLKQTDDPYMALVENLGKSIEDAGNHGSFWVDYLPFLRHVPAWLPGAEFKRKAETWAGYSRDFVESPWEWLTASIDNATAQPSLSTRGLARWSLSAGDGSFMESVVKNTVATSYIAAAETTPCAILTFILAMILNPDVQAHAQAEINDVIGSERLPDVDDRDSLPFVKAVIAETLRWSPVLPLVISHRAVNDDTYDGWFIPAGTTIVPNVWAVVQDETVYGPNVEKFDPERFLKQDGKELPPNPELFIFGFGRRICPGRYFAMNTLFLVVTHLLATFTMKKPLDDEGKEVTPKAEWHYGLIWQLFCRLRADSPVPPGPAGLPLIGNLRNIARGSESSLPIHKEYLKMSQIYGDIIHLHVLGSRTIVLKSCTDMVALLEKRSYNYSDRPGK
ncbi:hypothetical protein PQX77_005231 [Marasmius sp. AFHP31]|nr:hypothetical protein PQX77_005231 [Marasmius sp. AFHP31]